MKIIPSNRSTQHGSLLLVTLMIAGIAGVTLGSYLMMTQQQNTSIFRSQAWNASMVVTEAGIEDGLQEINQFAGTLEAEKLVQWTNSTAGWTRTGNIYYAKRYITEIVSGRTLQNSYEVWIDNTEMYRPTVRAVGHVPWTYMHASAAQQQPLLAAIGGEVPPIPPSPSQVTLARNVFVKTQYDPLFVVAMAATDKIDLNGNNIETDSFDSSDPRYSTNGFYPEGITSMLKANGDVATTSCLMDAMNVGNADIRGSVMTGPGTNTIYIGANGAVGDSSWVTGTNGIQDGHSSTDFNVAFPPVELPKGVMWNDLAEFRETFEGTNYQYKIIRGGDYRLSSPNLNGSLYITGLSNEIVRIRITSPVSLSGNDVIRIAPTGVKVYFYMEGASFTLGGSSYVDNQSGLAGNFYLLGLPTCRTISWSGNADFYGGIYAPQADFTLGAGGSGFMDFVGASVTRTVTMTGHYRFHFDENLAKVGPARGFIPVSWKEI